MNWSDVDEIAVDVRRQKKMFKGRLEYGSLV